MNPLFQYAVAAASCYDNYPAQLEDADHDIHVYLSRIDGAICASFEGTSTPAEWIKDFEAVELVDHRYPQIGPVHAGIASGVLAIFDKLKAMLSEPEFDLVGHSKGAGEALIAAGLFAAIDRKARRVRAFEAPRVGGPKLRDALADVDVIQTQTRNSAGPDIVTRVPWDGWAGQTWLDVREPLTLIVPDSLTVPQKHRIGAILTALAGLPEAPTAVAA